MGCMSISEKRDNPTGSSISNEILQGPIVPISIKLALPIIIGQLLQLGYSLTNTMFVSMINKESTTLLTGIGLVFPIHMCFLALSIGLFTGMNSVVSRGIGEKNQQVIHKTGDSGVWLAIALALLTVSVLYVFSGPIVRLLAGTEMSTEAVNNGLSYLHWILPGLGMMLISQSLLGILQGEGLSKYYGMALMLSTVLNIILDPIFIFYFGMGVSGAALATTIAITVMFLFVVGLFLKKKSVVPVSWKTNKVDFTLISKVIYVGFPQTLSMISLSVMSAFLNNLIGSISEHAMNSWILVGRFDEFLLLAGYGFGSAALTMIGQNYGNGNMDRVLRIFKTNVLLAVGLCSVFLVIYNVFAPHLFPLFTSIPEVAAGAVKQVHIISVSCIGIVIAIVATSSFQATGRAMPGLILDILRMGLLTIPLSYILFYWLKQGTTGIFFGMAGINLIMMVISFAWCYFYLKNIKQVKVLMESMTLK